MPQAKLDNAEKIYDMLMSCDFEHWYEHEFQDHVEGEEECKCKRDIMLDIIQMQGK